MAQVVEIETLDGLMVVYNLHLESRSVSARMGQVEETLADARKYPRDVPVVIAGDLNTHFIKASTANDSRRKVSRVALETSTRRRSGSAGWIGFSCGDLRNARMQRSITERRGPTIIRSR